MTIAEILEHPWMKEDMASEEEVLEEMNNRRWIISGTTPDADMPSSDPNIFDKVQQAHRGFGDKGVEADSINFSQLKVKPYLEGVSKGNVFYSTSEAFELYKVLLEYANNKGQVTLSEKSLKVTLKIIDENSTLNV